MQTYLSFAARLMFWAALIHALCLGAPTGARLAVGLIVDDARRRRLGAAALMLTLAACAVCCAAAFFRGMADRWPAAMAAVFWLAYLGVRLRFKCFGRAQAADFGALLRAAQPRFWAGLLFALPAGALAVGYEALLPGAALGAALMAAQGVGLKRDACETGRRATALIMLAELIALLGACVTPLWRQAYLCAALACAGLCAALLLDGQARRAPKLLFALAMCAAAYLAYPWNALAALGVAALSVFLLRRELYDALLPLRARWIHFTHRSGRRGPGA